MAITVTGLYRYPVKSMGGETLEALTLGPNGVPGDRAWAVRDEKRGGIRGAKHFRELMQCSARYEEEPAAQGSSPAIVTLPSGESFNTGDEALPGKLGELVNCPVSFWPLMPPDMLDHYRRGAPVLEDMEAEWRRVFARPEGTPLPDLSVFPPELFEFESPLGTYFDAFPILLLTRQSLDTLAKATPESRFDVRRFRPNLLLDAPSDKPFPELEWIGKEITVGSATLKVELHCPRCQMTTHGFDDLPRDPKIMQTMIRESEGNLGVYASVVTPGTVNKGAEMTVQ